MPPPDHGSLPAIFTADEAAQRLKLTKRAVITYGKRYGLCAILGRTVIFTEQHLVDLLEAARYKPSSPTEERYSSAYEGRRALERLRNVLKQRKQELGQQHRREPLAKERGARSQKAEPLDAQNRDPAYWTLQRKRRLRQERLARRNMD